MKKSGWFGSVILGISTFIVAMPSPAALGQPVTEALIAINDSKICLSPYTWKITGEGETVRAEAMMPGAYFRAVFTNSSQVGVVIDGTANHECPPEAMPVVDFSIDGGQFQTVQLKNRDQVETLPLADGLVPGEQHWIEFYFRSAHLGPDRWGSSAVHLRLVGIALAPEGSLLPCPVRARRAIGFGDSITEGVCSEGTCPYYSNLMMNNARVTWFPLVCQALGCEYGQLGSGGQGVLKPMSLPPLPQSWDHFDATTSRLTDGLLQPEPDYVFCCMGTNDFQGEGPNRTHMDITAAYTDWLKSVRRACPNTRVFCVTPPIGWHTGEIAAAVASRNSEGDKRVYLIDTTPLQRGYGGKNEATQYAPDGCHPTVYGNAVLGALVTAEAMKHLNCESGQ